MEKCKPDSGSLSQNVRSQNAVLLVSYPLEYQYAHDCLQSLSNQTNQDFDLVLLNDGLENLHAVLEKFPALTAEVIEPAGSISLNRSALIAHAKEQGYRNLILADIDDVFANDRVAVLLSLLDRYDVVVNDICAFSDTNITTKKAISSRFFDLQELTISDILDKNLFGMSNTGFRAEAVDRRILNFPSDLAVVDWVLFSRILLREGVRAVFTAQTTTYYRQHENNIAGLVEMNELEILKTIQVRARHFEIMNQWSPETYGLLSEQSKELLVNSSQSHFVQELVEINAPTIGSLWWELYTQRRQS